MRLEKREPRRTLHGSQDLDLTNSFVGLNEGDGP